MLVVVFAAVGAMLVASTQLSNLGQFDLEEWRLWLAADSSRSRSWRIGGAFWFAVRVLVGGRISIDGLVEEADNNPESRDVEFVNSRSQLRASFSTVKALRNE